MKTEKSFLQYTFILLTAMLSALNYKLFVFPNSFAPAGIDGICTMIQYIAGANIGYLSLLFNLPLLLTALLFFRMKKSTAFKTVLYVLAFSAFSICLDIVDVSFLCYHTENGSSVVLAPVVAGVVRGLLYPVTLRAGGTSGGMDIVAEMVRSKKPHYNMMNLLFALNTAVALCAYFVYDFRIEPVACSILYAFVTSAVSKAVQSVGKKQIRFEIITSHAEELCENMRTQLGVSGTLIDAQGIYSGVCRKMVICVTDAEHGARLEALLCTGGDAVVFKSEVSASAQHPTEVSQGAREAK